MAKKRKRRGPYDPYPGWAPQLSEEDFYRLIGNGPVSFTRPSSSPPAAPAAEQRSKRPPPVGPRPISRPRTGQ